MKNIINLLYIDPGSGSFIFQVLIGTILSLIYAIKIYWKNMKIIILNIIKGNNNKINNEK